MKLSWKLFCMAYVIVLLTTGLGGFFLITGVTDTLWDERIMRLETSADYAIDSFLSLSKMSVGQEEQRRNRVMEEKIIGILDSTVQSLTIESGDIPAMPREKEGYRRLVLEDGRYQMQLCCGVKAQGQLYRITLVSDFTDLQVYCDDLWRVYYLFVFSVAILTGVLLLLWTHQVVRPIKGLTAAANFIADGHYGQRIALQGNSSELVELSERFNHMSCAVADAMEAVNAEVKNRETFVANFAHEIKTPTTAIIGYADLLRSYDLNEEERTKAADAVYKEGRRLEQLAMQLLELFVTQNEAVQMTAISTLQLKAALQETFAFAAGERGISLAVELPKGFVRGNQALLLSLLYNLADNAFQASAPGMTVTVRGSVEGDLLCLSVTDTGRGIPEEHLPWITEPFYREDKARSRKNHNAGLGLTLCKTIADLHGTKLTLQSEVGEGTTVSFCLPWEGEEV